jgi:hypothetical protein
VNEQASSILDVDGKALRATAPQATTHAKASALAIALVEAVKSVGGTVPKDGWNKGQGFSYTSHEQVVVHTRSALSVYGLALIPTSLEPLGEYSYKTTKGEGVARTWRQEWLLEHAPSGETRKLSVVVSVPSTDKSASVASSTAERLQLLRLFHLAGSDQEYDKETGEVNGAQRKLVELVNGLASDIEASASFNALAAVVERARKQLEAAKAPDDARAHIQKAIDAKCSTASVDAAKLGAPIFPKVQP